MRFYHSCSVTRCSTEQLNETLIVTSVSSCCITLRHTAIPSIADHDYVPELMVIKNLVAFIC